MTVRGQRSVMHDVARLAGVSHQTVSRVLNGHPHVSSATRARVVAAMRELDYRPNAFARGLVTQRSQRIGVLSFDSRLFGPGSTLHAIERAARAAGFGVAVAGTSDHSGGDAEEAMEVLQSQAVDGIIVIAPTDDAVEALGVLATDVPVVALEAEFRDQPVVSIDQQQGARLATRHLLDLGHHTVWHVEGPRDWREAVLRADGWRAALQRRRCRRARSAVRRLEPPFRLPRGPRAGRARRRDRGLRRQRPDGARVAARPRRARSPSARRRQRRRFRRHPGGGVLLAGSDHGAPGLRRSRSSRARTAAGAHRRCRGTTQRHHRARAGVAGRAARRRPDQEGHDR